MRDYNPSEIALRKRLRKLIMTEQTEESISVLE